MSAKDVNVTQVIIERLEHVQSMIARGKGEWPLPGYVKDETWAGWKAVRSVLRSILREVGVDPDAVIDQS